MEKKLRYSDEDLQVFQEAIEKKLEKAERELNRLEEQLRDRIENGNNLFSSDYLDNSSVHMEVDLVHTMAERQRKFIHNLKQALVRIEQKTYGVCTITGALIEKRRLLAVPTTTKSIIGKSIEADRENGRPVIKKPKPPKKRKTEKRIVTIRKSNPAAPTNKRVEEDWLEHFMEDEEELELLDIPEDFAGESEYSDPDEEADVDEKEEGFEEDEDDSTYL